MDPMQVGLRNSIEQSYTKHTLQNYDTGPDTVRHWEVRNRLGGISRPVGTPYVPRPSKLGPIEGGSAPAKAPEPAPQQPTRSAEPAQAGAKPRKRWKNKYGVFGWNDVRRAQGFADYAPLPNCVVR